MNAFPPAWVGPRGIVALCGLALVSGWATLAVPWPVAVGCALAAACAVLAADAAMVARAPEIVRSVPAQFMLARSDSFRYDVVNRSATRLRFAIFEAPAAKLEVALRPARGSVAAAGRTTVAVGFIPRERGRTTVGVAFAWFESPLGFVRRRIRVGVAVPCLIRPDLHELAGSELANRTTLINSGLRRIRRRGSGTDFESLRDYAAGDPFRTIDWKATARRGKVMVAQYEVERSQQIVVAVDAGRLMSVRLGDRRKLDYAVSSALAIASIARRSGDSVGLHAFAVTTLATVGPRSGSAQTVALTDALSELEPHFEESDYERAALSLRRRYRKRSLIVVFTDLFDPAASGAVLSSLALLAPHHLVLVVLMNDAAIADALHAPPLTVTDVYRTSVAVKLAAERAAAVAALRSRGIGVVDVPARDLTIGLLDAYVEVKTRGLL